MSEAETADQYEERYIIGWLRAKHDGLNKGHFEPRNYPLGEPENDGYEAFVQAVRERSMVA